MSKSYNIGLLCIELKKRRSKITFKFTQFQVSDKGLWLYNERPEAHGHYIHDGDNNILALNLLAHCSWVVTLSSDAPSVAQLGIQLTSFSGQVRTRIGHLYANQSILTNRVMFTRRTVFLATNGILIIVNTAAIKDKTHLRFDESPIRAPGRGCIIRIILMGSIGIDLLTKLLTTNKNDFSFSMIRTKNANNLGDKFKGKSETPMSKNIRLIGVPAHSP